jgi:hypothetical protein
MAGIKETSIDILYEKLTCCLFFTDGIPEEIMDAINLPSEKRCRLC